MVIDAEQLLLVRAVELLEPSERHFGRACGELKKTRALLRRHLADDGPEPLDDSVLGRVRRTVLCVALPVVDIDVVDAADEKLELFLVKDPEELERNDVVEPVEEHAHPVLDDVDEAELDNKAHVFLLVRVGDVNGLAAGLELDAAARVKLCDVVDELLEEHAVDIVCQHPSERVRKLRVNDLHVRDVRLLAQHHFVEVANKERVHKLLIEHSNSNEAADAAEHLRRVLVEERDL
eukprot:Amastigsp_a842032_75.p2 type:complete len:235 gc:universal Amastigsp_a842032_75:208-912(+)